MRNSADPDQLASSYLSSAGLGLDRFSAIFYEGDLLLIACCTLVLKVILAISVDPDQTPQNAASDQGLCCLH